MASPSFTDKLSLFLRIKSRKWAWRLMKEPHPEKWVFIIGCYNSGTTLLNRLLAAHPQIGSMPNEGQFYTDQLPRGAQFGLRRLWALKPELFYLNEMSSSSIEVSRMKREWAWFYNEVNRPVLLEKTIANAARTRWLQKNFANTSFIILLRDPYAVAEGIRRKEGHSLEEAILQWKNSYELVWNDLPFLERKLVLKYEDLVADTDGALKEIAGFLHLNAFEKSLSEETFDVHKVKSKIENMNASSYAKLSSEDFETINRIAGELIVKLGYTLMA